MKNIYLAGIGKGYVLCTSMTSTAKKCRGEFDATQSFGFTEQLLPGLTVDDKLTHYKYRPLINMFITAQAGKIFFYVPDNKNSGLKLDPAKTHCQIGDSTKHVSFH